MATPLPPSVCKTILDLRFSAKERARMNRLAEKARKGTLTQEEDDELERFIRVGDLLAIMQSKARQLLGKKLPKSG
jgi:hypothetical protein